MKAKFSSTPVAFSDRSAGVELIKNPEDPVGEPGKDLIRTDRMAVVH